MRGDRLCAALSVIEEIKLRCFQFFQPVEPSGAVILQPRTAGLYSLHQTAEPDVLHVKAMRLVFLHPLCLIGIMKAFQTHKCLVKLREHGAKRCFISCAVRLVDSDTEFCLDLQHPAQRAERPEQIAPLSKFCQQHHIKLVVPFSSLGDNVYENPYYYAINPPKSYQFAETSRLTTELFGKDNVIFLEGTENDKDAAAFIDATRKRLQQNGSKANRLKLNDDEIKWMEAMTQYKDNVIIPNSSGIKLLNQLFPKLKEFTKKNPEYRIKLVGYPEWQTYASNHLENFYQFNTYAYSSFFRNPLNGNADEFENAYQKAFHTPTLVSWPRFGMLGFDTAIYFLKGISTYGEAFDQHLSQIVTTSYQHRFDFQRISNWSGFINREVEFIHYSPSHSIELIRLKK